MNVLLIQVDKENGYNLELKVKRPIIAEF